MPQIYRILQFAYYDNRSRQAYNAYRIDRKPDGALSSLITCVTPAKSRLDGPNCQIVHAIKNPPNVSDWEHEFVRWDTLPSLLSWLTDNGYSILPSMDHALMHEKSFMIRLD